MTSAVTMRLLKILLKYMLLEGSSYKAGLHFIA